MYKKAFKEINIFLEEELRLDSNKKLLLDGYNRTFPCLRLPVGTIAYMYKDTIPYIVLNPDDFIMIGKEKANFDIIKLFFTQSNIRLGYLTSNIDNPYQLAYIPVDSQIPITTLLDVSDNMVFSATHSLNKNSTVLVPYDEILRNMLQRISNLVTKRLQKDYPIKFTFNRTHSFLNNNVLYVPYHYITKIYNGERTVNDSILLLTLDFKETLSTF